jgi:hypothetical protein
MRWWRREHSLVGAARHGTPGEPLHKIIGAIKRCGFSPEEYVGANPDLRQLPDTDAVMVHLIATGIDEGRQFPVTLDLDGLEELGELRLAPEFKAAAAALLVNNGLAPASPFWSRTAGEQRSFWTALIPALRKMATPYLIVGDSHSGLYRHMIADAGRLPLVPVHVLLSACSALGLGNPDSRSGATRRLAPLAEAIPPDARAIFKFGQVDVEFVFAFRRIEAGQAQFDPDEFDRFCRRSVRSYVGFLEEHFRHADIAVVSTFPPTLSDDAWREGYMNAQIAVTEGDLPLEALRAGIKQLQVPGLIERTRHHAHYNEILRHHALCAGFAFIDDFSPFVGAGGIVDPEFIPTTGGRDHHLERSPTAPIIKAIIARTVLP